jgi:hypothetical protein
MNSTKRLSTIKTPGSPKNGLKGPAGPGGGPGGVKDVVSPGELCGFVRDFYLFSILPGTETWSHDVYPRPSELKAEAE